MTHLSYRPQADHDALFSGTLRDAYKGAPKLGVIRVAQWLPDDYQPDQPIVIIGRNGRPRGKITLPGHGKGISPPNKGKTFPPEPLTPAEVLLLLKIIDPTTKAGVRNRALIALLWRTGLRISEALDLRPHHVDFGARRVTVLHGKGDKRRTVGIDDGGLVAVQPWLLERQLILAAVPDRLIDAPLFCTIQLPGRGGRMHDAYIRAVLHKYGRTAGILKRVHPHGLRHTIACDLIKERFGITDVQAQLGHSNVATTATYLKGLGADEAFERVASREWPGGGS